MAGFEITRIGSVGDMAREWKPGRLLPLYIAGIAVGVAGGIGLTIRGDDAPPAPVQRPAYTAPAVVQASPSWLLEPSVAPASVAPGADAAHVVLPETMILPIVAPPVAAPVPIAAAAPAAPAAPAVAPVAVPAAPAVPAVPAVPVAAKPASVPESAPAPAPAAAAPTSDFYVPAVASGGASNLELRLLDGMNAERAKAGLPPFVYDAGLTRVARTRSQQMADQNYFAHVDPAGYSMYTALLKHFGYTSYAWAGENLAMNNYAAAEASERSLITLMNSPTHRANILADDFFRVGVGEVTTADGRHIFAMIFLG